MLQFYFLSVFANILAGITLTADFLSNKFTAFAPFKDLFGKREVRGSIAVLAAAVGFLKLLIRSNRNDVPFIGDFLPALAGLCMGAVLFFDFLKDKEGTTPETMGSLEKAVVTYRVPLGITGIIISVLHFLLPGALLL